MTAVLERPAFAPAPGRGRHRKPAHPDRVRIPAAPDYRPAPPHHGRHRKPAPPQRIPLLTVRMADLAAVGAVAGAVALTGVPFWLRAACLVVFLALGPGSAVLTWVPVPRRMLPATVPVLGIAIATSASIVSLWCHHWAPSPLLGALVVAAAASSAYWYLRNNTSPRDVARRWTVRTVPAPAGRSVVYARFSLALSAGAVLVWLVALPGLPGLDASFYGLLFSGTGPLLAIGIVACCAALILAVRSGRVLPAVAAVAAAIVVARVTTFAATEAPLYDWTYKHLAVVDYIMVHGRLTPDGTDIYAQWPAFFAVWAWFCEITGVAPMTVAHVFAPAMHVLIALTVYTAARAVGRSRLISVTAAFVAEIVNWVGQDYFSPQAWSLVLAFGVLALLLASPRHPACGVLAIVVFAAIVPSHQLTPFWIVAVALALCAVKRARPWWVALAMGAITAAYLLLNLEAVLPYGLLSGGSPLDNAASNVQTSGVPAKDFTSAVVRSLSAGVVLAAVAASLWLWHTRRRVLGPAVMAFASFGLLLGQSYGGEAIFRVYLYALLGMSILIAPALVAAIRNLANGARRAALGVVAALTVSTAGLAGLHGYLALWPIVYETRAQIEAMDALTRDADVRTRMVMLRHGGMPTRLNAGYADVTLHNPYFDEPVTYDLWDGREPRLPELQAGLPSERDLRALYEFATYDADVAYVILSEQSNRAMQYYGNFHPAAAGFVEDELRRSPMWAVVHEDAHSIVFRTFPGRH
ncbi:hypothetical protein [Mycolicibacterium vaccae]|uniref:hypothetical protein n=1 Tax=Mycolicibacterium vaccae TaxID=1810 RepID=UPI003D043DDB